jgi:hypothetical protein
MTIVLPIVSVRLNRFAISYFFKKTCERNVVEFHVAFNFGWI